MKDDPCEFPPVVLNYGPEPDPVQVAAYMGEGFNLQQAYEMAQDKALASKIRGVIDGKPPFERLRMPPKREWMP